MGSRIDAAVTLVIKARDRLSKVLDRIGNKSKSTATRVKASLEKINKAARKTQGIMAGMMGSMAITAGMFALSMGARKVTEEFVGMDQALTSAAAKFPEAINRGTKEFEKLEAAARRVGGATEFTSKEAGEGLEFLAMAGFSASQAVSALPVVVDLATAANMDLARATDIASDALGAFNMHSENASIQTANLTRISDVFAKTTTSANVTLEHMFETMKDGGPVMTAAGQSVETFAALTGTLGNAGIKGSKAGTTLKNMMLRLIAPVGKGEVLIKKLGINVADSAGNMRDMLDIMDDVRRATAKMGEKQRLAALDVIFGKRAIAGVNVVLATGIDKIKKYRGELEKAKGASKDMADKMREGLLNRLKVLQSSLIELGFKVLEAFQEKFPGALDAAIAAVQSFDPRPMVDAIKSLIDIGKAAYQFFLDWKPVIIGLIGAFVALKAALGVATVALAIMNFVAMMNPWLLLAMAIGVVIALLWYYWDDVQKWAEGVVDSIMEMTDDLNYAFSSLGTSIYNTFVEAWNWILDIFGAGIRKVIGLVGSVSAVLGLDLDFTDAKKGVDDLFAAGKMETKTAMTPLEVRNKRLEFMGLPTLTSDQQAQIGLDRNTSRDLGARDADPTAPMYKKLVEEGSIKGFDPEQNTRVEVELDFKNLTDHFANLLSVGMNAKSSPGATITANVNKQRAGAN